ncbi:MAG: hypothetical protein AUJ52_14815 [Elusimicrobia bacterium CG1_02_63_36]|nr:MAG: hypothetical protein AUJ52_14815 [Elusimicrobia bacterium CG1_02_63_36]PJB24974.1 MAG: hypothetical protein CO113_11070 [Elusimicrobia bacterium CG_4_9_14_3_um_filter_62_55]
MKMNKTNPIDDFLPRLKEVKENKKGWIARCPAHEDKKRSLSVSQATDGKLLIKCFAGCETKTVVAEMGLAMRDLFPQKKRAPRKKEPQTLTLVELAADKKLPEEFLKEQGVYDLIDIYENNVVKITYRLIGGALAPRQRLRRALKAKDGSIWMGAGGRPVPYGLWRLKDYGKDERLYLVEGESDCWTLWYHGFAALGLPGANMTGVLEAEHVAQAARVYAIQEPDQGGEALIKGLAQRLREIGFTGEAFAVQLEGAKDANELHQKDAEGFKEALSSAVTGAKPLYKLASLLSGGLLPEKDEDADEDPTEFFNKKDFLPAKLCRKIMRSRVFISSPIDDAGKGVRLLTYEGGVFQNGASIARTIAHKKLDYLSKPDRLESTVALIKETGKKEQGELDPRALDLINLENGMLNWRTGELRPHSKNYLSTFRIHAAYSPEARCPVVERFLPEVFPEDALPLAEEMLGYLLLPTTRHQKAFMLLGAGANGKSTFLNAVEALLGYENISHVALQDMSDNRFAAAELLGKLANIYPDLPAKALEKSDVFKAVVTGDMIKAERKFQHPFDLRPYSRLLFSANELPPSRDLTPGFFRRWLIIPFPNRFEGQKADRGLSAKLVTPEARSAWLNRALAGLRRLEAQAGFTESSSVSAATEKYRRQCDNVYEFIEERLRVVQGHTLAKAETYEAYKAWAAEIGVPHPVSQKTFNKRLSETLAVREGREVAEGGRKLRVWLGLGWAEDAPDRDGPERPGSAHFSSPGIDLFEEEEEPEGERSEQAGLPGPSRSKSFPPELPERIEDWPEYYKDIFEEKAGTFEHEDGFSREEAEKTVESLVRQWYAVDRGRGDD